MNSKLLFDLLLAAIIICYVDGSKLNGSHLRVAGIALRPFLSALNPKSGIPRGVDTDIIKILAKKLNFTFEFHSTKTWGINQNGTWLGTIGEVFNGTADIGIGHLIINEQRKSSVAMSTPLYFLSLKFFTRRPQPLPQHFNLTKPFTAASWLAIVFSMLLLSLFSVIVTGMSKNDETPCFPSNLNNVLPLLGSFLEQSIKDLRKNLFPMSGHLFMASVFFFSTLILMSFQCNLRAYLMSVDYEPTVDTAEDVVRQGRKLYIIKDAAVNRVLAESESPFFQKIYEDIVRNEQYYPPSNAMSARMEQKLMFEKAVQVSSETMAKARVPDLERKYGFNPYRLGKESFAFNYCGFALSSSLQPILDPMFHHLKDTGVMEKVLTENLPLVHAESKKGSEERLKLDHMIFAIISWILGISMAVTVFIIEIGVKY